MNTTHRFTKLETKYLSKTLRVIRKHGAASAERIAHLAKLDRMSVNWALANLQIDGRAKPTTAELWIEV